MEHSYLSLYRGRSRGRVQGVPPPLPEMKLSSSYSLLKFVYRQVSDVFP